MGQRIDLAEGEYYHLYNRGTEKRIIYASEADYKRFQTLLYLSNSTNTFHLNDHRGSTSGEMLNLDRGGTLVDLCAYCLMPNHFHLLVREKKAGGISRFMQKLMTAYTMYFNVRHERNGALFQGKYKARHASNDRYLKYLISYIHLNPVQRIEPRWKETGISHRKRAERFLQEYPYSSYLDYCDHLRHEKNILDVKALPEYFDTPDDFKKHVNAWLSRREEDGGQE